ncbi:helix-turn-helix domain-containing protein [Natronomonas halophila]|uniref:helix-turn-helix domain-containing protein n=1 Tax=Natronomonas halophila TaxID=2747817 RepID=UPI0015B462D4|nr:helix-turn-helix domain-containing protein [Natronomonas halophila]QLD87036.1 helix-turn-helix domain-containing protein [Natronomonas halophila]
METSPYVIEYLVAGEDRWMAVSQFEPTEAVRRGLELKRESRLIVETHVRFTADDYLKITYIGSDETFRKLSTYVEGMDGITFDILDVGDYGTDESSFSRMITPRQEEVLESEVDLVYYREPRQASLEDVRSLKWPDVRRHVDGVRDHGEALPVIP